MKVSVIIPNYNGQLLLQKNLPHVLGSLNVGEVIVVDDSSNDGSVQFIKAKYPQVKLIEKASNHGFSTSVNLGVKAASHELVVLLNSDATPQKDFLRFALPHFTDPRLFAVGCLDLSIEDNLTLKRGRGEGRFIRGFLIHRRGETDRNDTLWVSGGSGIFRRTIWERLGGFDELYNPFYWEDIDLSYRAQKMGYKVLFEAKSVVTHRHNEGAIRIHRSKKMVQTIAYRNQFLFLWINISDSSYLFEHLIWLPYHMFKALIRGDVSFISGLGEALLRLPQVIRHRQRIQKAFIKSDWEILKQFT